MGKLMQAPHGPARSWPAVAEDDDLEADSDFEDELFGLLARLEHQREGLAFATAGRKPVQAVEKAVDLLGHVTQFSSRHFPFAGPEVRDAFARAGEFHAALELLRTSATPTNDPARTP